MCLKACLTLRIKKINSPGPFEKKMQWSIAMSQLGNSLFYWSSTRYISIYIFTWIAFYHLSELFTVPDALDSKVIII